MQNRTNSRILVVDDEIRVCESIKALLVRKGFDIHTALTVDESIRLCEKVGFDLFLIDKNLPGEDGFVFIDYILERFPRVPFVVMTGNASIDSAILSLKKGAYDYLRKPFKYEELINVVSHALLQKRLEDENASITSMLNASEKRYREMIQNSPDLIIILDSEGCIRFVNKTLISTLGYRRVDELQGIPFTEIVERQYVDSVRSFLGLSHSPVDEEPSAGIDIRMMRSDGCSSGSLDAIDIELRKSNISLERAGAGIQGGDSSEICIVGRDIGFRKAFEQQMIYSQKMEAIALLAGGVAHDFNNLLMGIHGFASVMKSHIDVNHPCYRNLVSIEKNIAKGSHMTSQLLNFARGGAHNVEHTNINYVVKDALELFSINRKNIKIHLDLARPLWKVHVDTCQMEQVFLNMFINAHHAMEKGGELFIRTENCVVDAETSAEMRIRPGDYVRISIQDTGHGIDEKHHKKIFDPFFSTKRKSEGTGLGLASAYGIVKKHNGTITVSSSSGKGALFTIYLCVNSEKCSCEQMSDKPSESVVASINSSASESAAEVSDESRSLSGRLVLDGSGSARSDSARSGSDRSGSDGLGVDNLADAGKTDVKEEHPARTHAAPAGHSRNIRGIKVLKSSNQGKVEKVRNEKIDRLPASVKKRFKALVIDDEPDILEMTAGMFKEIGIDVTVASNGREGVQKYMDQMGRIDIVVLDMVMPGMGGVETFRYIRKLNPGAKVLIASAYGKENEITDMIETAGCCFLRKPYDLDSFAESVNSLLGIGSNAVVELAG